MSSTQETEPVTPEATTPEAVTPEAPTRKSRTATPTAETIQNVSAPVVEEVTPDSIPLITRSQANTALGTTLDDKNWASLVKAVLDDKEFLHYTKLRIEGFIFNYPKDFSASDGK